MSSHQQIEVECPSCRTRQDILVWHSIDATLNPMIKEQIVTGRINYFDCNSCDFEGFIAAPLFYHDQKKNIFACYVPVECLDDGEYLHDTFTPKGMIRQGLPEVSAGIAGTGDLPHAHIVFSMEELIRYVLFRERLMQVFEEE
jgi:hypothetical protein